MSAFKTPLFKVCAVLVFILSLCSLRDLFEPSSQIPPEILMVPGYHFLEGTLGNRLAKGWKFEVETVDEKPSRTRLLFLPPDISGQWTPGTRLWMWARFSPVQAPQWPGAFNWGRYLAKEGLSGTLLADNASDIHVRSRSSGPLSWLYRGH